MANYVDASSQTEWAGLMQKNIVRSEAFFAPYPATNTPPDEPLTKKEQCLEDFPSLSHSEARGQPQTPPQSIEPFRERVSAMSTSPLLSRSQNRPAFVAHIDLPSPEMRELETLDDEVPVSPPPSALVLSPVPEANRRFAGHTPLFPRSPSPDTPRKQPPQHLAPIAPGRPLSMPVHELIVEQDPSEDADTEPQPAMESQSTTPQEDVGLTGPLTLAPNPGDGTQDTILLSALDTELSRIARQQRRVDAAAEDGQPLSRQESSESRSSEVQPVDGVTLKKSVPMNFGAPLGQV
ncbi:uncharacterized protein EKO05_0011286 [Ascochyta rabiei]|uniref:Uncharacterized protein n=1 Tax=Didymella rabiei TaxID=5454 RepID=A0A163K6S8_DIDRA|nr:uncharacterized protein EKO05_0011286 [Ascochyta rabiei]KZM26811.1 hypothetical protein ST47_g2040 [Ascochyta rabiei]UPX21082.1 hypothetical protein EKO05_0011286 [Ascochyta rabiei]